MTSEACRIARRAMEKARALNAAFEEACEAAQKMQDATLVIEWYADKCDNAVMTEKSANETPT